MGIVTMLVMIIWVMFFILAFTQVFTLVLGMGIGDGLGKPGLGYAGSWKTAGTAILESAPVIFTAVILMVVGLKTEGSISALSLFMSFITLTLFQMGLFAFMARKVAEDL